MNKIKVGEWKIKRGYLCIKSSVWPTSHSHVLIVFQPSMIVVIFPALEVWKCPQPDFAEWPLDFCQVAETNKQKKSLLLLLFFWEVNPSHADLPGGLCVCILFSKKHSHTWNQVTNNTVPLTAGWAAGKFSELWVWCAQLFFFFFSS